MNKLTSKLSRLENQNIIKVSVYINIVSLFILVLTMIYYWYQIIITSKFELWEMILALFIASVAIVTILMNTKLTTQGIEKILTENLDLDKYLDIYNLMFQKANRNGKEQQKLILTYTEGLVDYYRGNFQESRSKMLSIDYSKIQEKHRIKFILRKYNIELLSSIYLHDITEYRKLKSELENLSLSIPSDKELKSKILETTNAVYAIVIEKNGSNHFDKIGVGSEIDRISFIYYSALNSQLKGNEARTKELFASIADENSELFYVQEAKKYLEGVR